MQGGGAIMSAPAWSVYRRGSPRQWWEHWYTVYDQEKAVRVASELYNNGGTQVGYFYAPADSGPGGTAYLPQRKLRKLPEHAEHLPF